MPGSTGPAIRAVCRVVNGSSCGSGSICGHWNGGSLILTNAHVAGTKIGRVVRVEVESLGMRKLNAKVIRAAYSNQVSADWALLFVDGFQEISPVHLTKKLPPSGYSLYTRGFPRCQPHNGTDINQAATLNNGVLLWLPNSIGGQSGSGVWGDDDHLQYALLTWSMQRGGRWYGAGQLTGEIYRQNRAFINTGALVGHPKMPGLVELPGDFEFAGVDREGLSDPEVDEGIYSAPIETVDGIQDYPIWAEDQDPTPPPVDPGKPDQWRMRGIEFLRRQRDQLDTEIASWEKASSDPVDPTTPGAMDDLFGL